VLIRDIISDVVETVTWLKRRDRGFIKNPEILDLKFATETQDFKICTFAEFF